ncbi:MAG: tetratricopeptide repeat protein [Candidatus Omnitrophica bacterium]|nr:tetratricopeptide repeat protein [Candidatus Omnitrophota bacterium]
MRRIAAIGLLLVVAGASAWAQDAPRPQASEQQVNELIAQYTLLVQANQVSKAITMAERALAAAEAAYGLDHQQVAQVLNDLGYMRQRQSGFAQAEQLHRRALAIRERAFPPNDAAVVQSLNNVGKAYAAQNRFAEAAAVYQRSLALTERHVAPNAPHVLTVLEPYEHVLRRQGMTEAADAMAKRIKEIRAATPP